MAFKLTFEKMVYFTKLSVCLALSWPSSRVIDSKKETSPVLLDISWFLSLLSSLALLIPLLISMFEYHSNFRIVTQSACFVGATCNFIVKTIVCRVHRERMRTLIREMEGFLENAKAHEKVLLQRYIDKCSTFHVLITIVNYMTTAVVICGPVLLPQPFPTSAVYPFPVQDSKIGVYLVYIHQSFVGFQCSTGATIDCQIALMMWFAGARLELLADELKCISDIRQFNRFIGKHQRLLSYADEVSYTMCCTAITTTAMSGIGTIFSSLQLFGNQPMAVKLQFSLVALIATMNLFVCAWPADNLIRVCGLVGTAVYDTRWFDMSPKMMRNCLIILQRSQRPVIVSVGGFLPVLSLRFYAAYLSTILSYTTTLRVVISSESAK